MLRYWEHPLSADEEFRNELLEDAAIVLRSCVNGQQVLNDIPAEHTNFVAALWYVEWTSLSDGAPDPEKKRSAWLEKVRQSVPSCFCPPENLA
jgi:hypothetical protein